jgi:predicted DNA binding CopG/RHH family protein
MKKPMLPPVLTRRDFDAVEEYEYYLASEAEEFEPIPENIEEIRKKWQKSARETINGKRERITIAIPERNLSRIRSIALRRGIPYQTLINETLHKLAKQDFENVKTPEV